jgi:hypothetical protein
MNATDVTLSPGALASCERLGIDEIAIRRARADSVSEFARPAYLVVIGQLPDGRTIRLSCRHDLPKHVAALSAVYEGDRRGARRAGSRRDSASAPRR